MKPTMKLNKPFLIFLILILAFSSITTQNDSERDVRHMERTWLDAYETRHSIAMEEIVADDFTIIFPVTGRC